jgi:hypothetical protein
MGQHESINDKSAVPVETATPAAPAGGLDVTPKMALASLDPPKLDPPKLDPPKLDPPKLDPPKVDPPKLDPPKLAMPKVDMSKLDMPAIQTPKIESDAPTLEIPKIEVPKLKLATIEAPRIAPEIDELKPASEHAAADAGADEAAPEPPPAQPPQPTAPIVSRFTLLAASLALAAALGGMVGTLGALGLARPNPAPVVAVARTGVEEFQALKENVVQARVELAALKASIETGNRNAGAQLTKIGERIERVERLQSEPAAKLSKAVDTLDRLARAEGLSSKDVTGSVAPPQAIAGQVGKAIDGWVVRDVRRGTAFIEGRMGVIEVDQGDIVPGIGRVDAIRKQPDGRWVVVTTRGNIMSAR